MRQLGLLQRCRILVVAFTLMGHLREPTRQIELAGWGYGDGKGRASLIRKCSVCTCEAFSRYDGVNR